MRITQVRRQLLEVLFEAGEPLTLNEIRDRAVAKGTSPDYATVFRMVSLLEQMRVVK